jgi:drug/metabolite transporter (DMT)-like permease
MIGQFLALLSAVSLSCGSVFIRKAVFRIGESNAAYYISIFIGTIIFSLALVFSGEAGQLKTVSIHALVYLIGAGIVGAVIGRRLSYSSLKLVGATLTSPLLNISTVVAVIIGITLMGELLTLGKALGILLIVIGAVLISTEGGDIKGYSKNISRNDLLKGIACALSAGICYGISPVLVKLGIREGNHPITAAFIINATAMVYVLLMLVRHGEKQKIKGLNRDSLLPVIFGSVFQTLAQFCRYWALDHSPVSVVTPLISTATFITIILSYAVNRNIELFTWKIIVGAVFVVSGVFIVFQA